MKVFIEKRFIPKSAYQSFIDMYPNIEFVHDINHHKDIDIFFGLNGTLVSVNLDEYKQLKWIQLYMAGFDNVDVEGLKMRGLVVSNARDIFSITIAEDVISKILYFNRNLKEFTKNKKTRIWQPIWKDKEIWHSTIGVIGTGSIGQETAKRLASFEPEKIIGYRTKPESVPYFDEIYTGISGLKHVISESDYLILALPLNQDTEYLIDKEKLSWMKKDALLINVARGKIILQEDLIVCLEKQLIRGAALDVTDPEPLPEDSKLWVLDNCLITPHNASSSEHMVKRLFELTLDNLNRYLNNQEIKYKL